MARAQYDDLDEFFEEDEEESEAADGRGVVYALRHVIIAFIALGALVVLARYAHEKGKAAEVLKDIPLIRADEKPFKIKPENPGGMDIPHQDKTIYQMLEEPSGQKEEIKRILPLPEKPVPPSEVKPEDASFVKAREAMVNSEPVRAPRVEKLVGGSEKPKLKPATKPKATRVEKPKPAPKVKPLVESASKPKITPLVSQGGGGEVAVQLGALRTREEAELVWQKLGKSHVDVMPPALRKGVEPVAVEGKGTLYRLQAKGFASPQQAAELCKALTSRNQPCFVVK
jgi:hypothetical protein